MHLIRAFDAMYRSDYRRDVPKPDLNLLVALDVLLDEASVAAAARRLQLSASAMSRTLARLRVATGDPLLVRAGRNLVPTPHAVVLRDRVGRMVEEAEGLLRPSAEIDVGRIVRTFTLRTAEGFVENFGPELIRRVESEAPQVRLRFVPKSERDAGGLRDGSVDLETGVVSKSTSPEIRTRALFRDRFVGVVRTGHPLTERRVTPARFVAQRHVEIARHAPGPVDDALGLLGFDREISVVVGGFSAALALARASDYVATVPERHTRDLRAGMSTFTLPFSVPDFAVSLLWHPRLEADPEHRWLRRCVQIACVEPSA